MVLANVVTQQCTQPATWSCFRFDVRHKASSSSRGKEVGRELTKLYTGACSKLLLTRKFAYKSHKRWRNKISLSNPIYSDTKHSYRTQSRKTRRNIAICCSKVLQVTILRLPERGKFRPCPSASTGRGKASYLMLESARCSFSFVGSYITHNWPTKNHSDAPTLGRVQTCTPVLHTHFSNPFFVSHIIHFPFA